MRQSIDQRLEFRTRRRERPRLERYDQRGVPVLDRFTGRRLQGSSGVRRLVEVRVAL